MINNNKNKKLMKKNYLWIAAAAAMFAACSDNEIKNDVKDFGESAIAFSTYASPQTKAAENNKNATNLWDLENHHTTFDVWAWKYYNGAWVSTAVYNKGTVTHNGTAWSADPVKFWDKSAEKYIFYAAAPTDEKWTINNNGTAADFSDDYLTYANFTLAGTNISSTDYTQSFSGVADVDLMIAENNTVNRAAYNIPAPNDVNEKFDHILSRLNVTVALKAGGSLATNNATVKVTNFAITGVNLNNKGSFNENADLGTDVLANGTTKRWSSLSIDNGPYNLSGKDISNTTLTTSALYIAQYLIIPQSITNEVLDRANGKVDGDSNGVGETNASHPYFVISYTINGEPFTAYYNLANAFGKTGTETLAFNEGWQNTLNIQLDADIITFDAQVYEWTNANNSNVTIED
ncbi:MAG: hypothetical protein ACSW76_06845 [Bacteroidaceae bacterium]